MKKLIAVVLLLVSCGPDPPPPEYNATFTKSKIGPDEVINLRVFSVSKAGWLTSDRLHVHLVDGSMRVLPGNWSVTLEPIPPEEKDE